MPVGEVEVSGIQSLTGAVLTLHSKIPTGHFLWFRGVPCADFSLVAKLPRGSSSSAAMFDREERLLTRFRQRSLPFWPAGYPQTPWEHMFAMQHHGVPTRLLDWSENLYLGLYFALATGPQHPDGHDDPEHICRPTLWCLNPLAWNQGLPHLHDLDVSVFTTSDSLLNNSYAPATEDPNRLLQRHNAPVAMYGSHNSPRIVAQRGTFTVAGKGLAGLETFECADNVLAKFAFNIQDADLRKEMTALGFTESMIYPDLPALAKELAASVV
jgi:hypothetical protein